MTGSIRSGLNSTASSIDKPLGLKTKSGSIAASSPEETLSNLKKYCAQLEADQKTLTESTQWTQEQQRQLINQLKEEAKQLKTEVGVRGGTVRQEAGGGSSATKLLIEKREREVHELRRACDKVAQEKKTAITRIANLQEVIRDLGRNEQAVKQETTPGSRLIRQFENRLDKALLKCNEAASIKQTYEQMIEQMKLSQASTEHSMKQLREQLRQRSAEVEALTVTLREAGHARDAAKAQLAAVEVELAQARVRREAAVEEHKMQVKVLQIANKALLQQQFPTPTLPSLLPHTLLISGDTPPPPHQSQEGQAPAEPNPEGDQPSEPQGPSTETPEGAKPSTEAPVAKDLSPQEVCVKLIERTGCTDLPGVVARLISQQETWENLVEMVGQAAQQTKQLQSQCQLLRSQVEDLRSGGRLSTQDQLDAANADLARATAALDARRNHLDRAQRIWAEVHAGLEHVAAMVAPLPLSGPPLVLDDEMLGETITQIEARLAHALRFIKSIPKATEMYDNLVSNSNYSLSAESSGFMVS